MSSNNPVPVNEPVLNGNEAKYVLQCIESGWVSSEGPFVKQFEQQFAHRVGRQFGIAVSNGSAALDAAIAALHIGPGDEVILPTFTIISCAIAVVRAGATPVLVDCNSQTWNLDVTQLEAKITPRTKAVMVVHIYGLPVDLAPVLTLVEKHQLYLIEDAAEVHGQTYQGRPCGSFGDLSIFSFYSNKHITTGEGGMIVTDNPVLMERCCSLRNLYFDPKRRFVHQEIGWNLRMSNLQAALGVAQLERLEAIIERKRQIGRLYTELLRPIPGLQLPLPATDYADNIYWVYGVVLADDLALDAADLMQRLAVSGIGTRPFFWPMHEQPVFQRQGLFQGESYPVAERLARRGFYLPSGLALTDAQVERVAQVLQEAIT